MPTPEEMKRLGISWSGVMANVMADPAIRTEKELRQGHKDYDDPVELFNDDATGGLK
jgi:hypothetical protein